MYFTKNVIFTNSLFWALSNITWALKICKLGQIISISQFAALKVEAVAVYYNVVGKGWQCGPFSEVHSPLCYVLLYLNVKLFFNSCIHQTWHMHTLDKHSQETLNKLHLDPYVPPFLKTCCVFICRIAVAASSLTALSPRLSSSSFFWSLKEFSLIQKSAFPINIFGFLFCNLKRPTSFTSNLFPPMLI